MKQTTIRMHMNPEESLGTVGHVIDKDLRNKEAHINPNGDFEVWVNKGVYGRMKFSEKLLRNTIVSKNARTDVLRTQKGTKLQDTLRA